MDRRLDRMTTLVGGRRPPTWIVEYLPRDSWELDSHRRLDRLVRERYRLHGRVCGRPVYVLDRVGRRPIDQDCPKVRPTG